jgi:hypothetical protein
MMVCWAAPAPTPASNTPADRVFKTMGAFGSRRDITLQKLMFLKILMTKMKTKMKKKLTTKFSGPGTNIQIVCKW